MSVRFSTSSCTSHASFSTSLVYFTAAWCGPCQQVEQLWEGLAVANAGSVFFAKVDVDKQPEIAQRCGVKSMPTFQVFKDGMPQW